MSPRRGERTPQPHEDDEAHFLREYRRTEYARPSVAVDLCVFTVRDALLHVLLVRRREPPFRGWWALPGGFVRVGDAYRNQGEDLDEAAHRVLVQKTGLPRGTAYLEQLHAFGRAGRDPRMRVISVGFYALVRPDLMPLVHPGSGTTAASWIPVEEAESLKLAFDHRDILRSGLQRLRDQLDRTDVAFELVPATFTISELRNVFEIVKGTAYDKGNFRRKFQRLLTDGVIERAPGKRLTPSKPAQVFRFHRRR